MLHADDYEAERLLELFPEQDFQLASEALIKISEMTEDKAMYDARWVSGTNGTIVRSYDQGHTWRVQQVEGAEKLDFRDLHVIDENTVVAMTSGTPARIYRTDNRGDSWKVV